MKIDDLRFAGFSAGAMYRCQRGKRKERDSH